MPASDDITYNIPPLVLGDTFYEWMQITNTDIIGKLNEMSAYSVSAGDGISASTNTNGQVDIEINPVITKGITFDGDVQFNGSIIKINSMELTVDDYNLMLGAVPGLAGADGGTTDANIDIEGGGGVILKRYEGDDAKWLWKSGITGPAAGCSGAWYTNQNISLTGGTSLMSKDDILRFKSGANATGSGIMLTTIDAPGNFGTSSVDKLMRIGHMSTGGIGITHGIHFDDDGLVRIYDGVNKKIFTHDSSPHGFTFGDVVRIGAGGTCQNAHAGSKEDAEVFGVVSEVIDAAGAEFVVTMTGEIHGEFKTSLSNYADTELIPGDVYFLSGSSGVSGEITGTEITDAGKIRKPVVIGLGATSGYVVQYVGAKIAAETDSNAPTMRRISVDSGGNKVGGSNDIDSATTGTGLYTITHNFGTTAYSAVISVFEDDLGWIRVKTKTADTCTVETYERDIADASADLVNKSFEMILAKDVT